MGVVKQQLEFGAGGTAPAESAINAGGFHSWTMTRSAPSNT
jgi:hypothetical protein